MVRLKSMVVLVVIMVASFQLQSTVAQTTHVVGDALGWTIPRGGVAFYTTWASQQTFTIGDTLVFNFTTGLHSVAEVSSEAYGSCTSSNPISLYTSGPTTVTLTSTGYHYYICTFASHCLLGQRLIINVSPGTAIPPPPPTTPSPQPSHVVGDALGWTIPLGGSAFYTMWASQQTFVVGDTLLFNFTTGLHSVAEVSLAAYGPCNSANPISLYTGGPTMITLTIPGNHYYICTFASHCLLGQRLTINVSPAPVISQVSPYLRHVPSLLLR